MKTSRVIVWSAVLVIAFVIALVLWRWIESREKPSVLLITLDTTRADRLGCYGYANAATPALERLAREGMRFTRAYSHVPLTLPSHATIMTGMLPPEHGVRDNGRSALDPSIPTLAESFRSHGYRTAAFLASFTLDRRFGLSRGFDVYDDRMRPAAREDDLLDMENPGDVVCDRALAWLKESPRKPFFCWVHFYDPHFPYVPPEPYRSRLKDPYDGEIAFMDTQIARLLDFLDREGLTGRTVIIACGDHGESFGEHRESGHGGFIYGATLHVPLLIRDPGLIPAGRADERLAGLEDIAPTVAGILGWKRNPAMRGENLLREAPAERYAYGESQFLYLSLGWSPLYSLTSSRWKYIQCPNPELYDLQADPAEMTNVLAARPDVANDLAARLEQTRRGMTSAKANPVALDTRALKTLQSLGYLAGGTAAPRGESVGLKDPKSMVDIVEGCAKARVWMREGRAREVVDLLAPLVLRSPESKDLHKHLAEACSALNLREEAAKHMEAALALDPQDRVMAANLGGTLVDLGDLKKAVDILQRGLSLPRDPLEPALGNGASRIEVKLHADLASGLQKTGRIREAAQQAELALRDDPANADAHTTLGNILNDQGRFDAAVRQYQAALSANPTNAFVLSDLGVALARMGRIADSLAAHRQAIAVSPDVADFHVNFSVALAANRQTEDAVRECREARRLSPRSALPLRALASALVSGGRRDEALKAYEQAVALEKSADLYHSIAVVLDELGRLDEAIAAYRQALDLDPRAVSSRNNLGLMLCQKKQYGDALTVWRAGLALDPEEPHLIYNMAWWLATCPDPAVRNGKEAIEWAEKLNGGAAGNAQFTDVLAAAYAAAGRFEEAVQTAKKAVAQARAAGADPLASAIERRLALYAKSKPYVQPIPAEAEDSATGDGSNR